MPPHDAACGDALSRKEPENTEPTDEAVSDVEVDTSILCGVTDLAPPSEQVIGGLAVPIDVQLLEADVMLRIADQKALAKSRMSFLLGPTGGFPVFDLRQTPMSVELDDEPLDVGLIERVEFASTDTGGVLVLHRELQPCSRHELVIEYELKPTSDRSMLPHWAVGVFWNAALGDGTPGMLLERWLPVGLIHDSFQLGIEVRVEGGDEHTFLANAPVEILDFNHWRATWPAVDSSMALWYLSRTEHILHWEDELGMVDLYYAAQEFGPEQDEWLSIAQEAISEFSERFGARADQDRPYLLIIDGFQQLALGTEYANGAIVGLPTREILRHEILHAWLGRSLLPARHVDAWWDEGAVTFFSADDPSTIPFALEPLDPNDPEAEAIAPSDPWTRAFPYSAYTVGARVFATVVEVLGRERVEGVLRGLIEECPHGHITHHDLVESLARIGERDRLEAVFASWVLPKGDAIVHGTCR